MKVQTYVDKRLLSVGVQTSKGLFLAHELPQLGDSDTHAGKLTYLYEFDAELEWYKITGRPGLVLHTGTEEELRAFKAVCLKAIDACKPIEVADYEQQAIVEEEPELLEDWLDD